MANKIQVLTDFPEFSEAAERLSKLRLRKSGIDEKIKVLTTQIRQINADADNQGVDALINNPDVELPSYEKRDLDDKISELKTESDALQIAINKVRNQLDATKQKILPEIAEQFRPQHEKLVQKYIDSAKKVVAARQEILDFNQKVGESTNLNPGDLIPVFHLRTLGEISDSYSFLGLLATKARNYGYTVE